VVGCALFLSRGSAQCSPGQLAQRLLNTNGLLCRRWTLSFIFIY
jgi:hypothetical protein